MEVEALIVFEPDKKANIEHFLKNDIGVLRYMFFDNSVSVVISLVVRSYSFFMYSAYNVIGVVSVKRVA